MLQHWSFCHSPFRELPRALHCSTALLQVLSWSSLLKENLMSVPNQIATLLDCYVSIVRVQDLLTCQVGDHGDSCHQEVSNSTATKEQIQQEITGSLQIGKPGTPNDSGHEKFFTEKPGCLGRQPMITSCLWCEVIPEWWHIQPLMISTLEVVDYPRFFCFHAPWPSNLCRGYVTDMYVYMYNYRGVDRI